MRVITYICQTFLFVCWPWIYAIKQRKKTQNYATIAQWSEKKLRYKCKKGRVHSKNIQALAFGSYQTIASKLQGLFIKDTLFLAYLWLLFFSANFWFSDGRKLMELVNKKQYNFVLNNISHYVLSLIVQKWCKLIDCYWVFSVHFLCLY